MVTIAQHRSKYNIVCYWNFFTLPLRFSLNTAAAGTSEKREKEKKIMQEHAT